MKSTGAWHKRLYKIFEFILARGAFARLGISCLRTKVSSIDPRVIAVGSSNTEDEVTLSSDNIGKDFIAAMIGPSRYARADSSSSNR